jgi:hypothetical protein
MGSSPLIEVRVPHFANTLSHPDIVVRRCNVLDSSPGCRAFD